MSELLQHHILPTSFQRKSQNFEYNVSIVNKTNEPGVGNTNKRLIKSKSNSQKHSTELKSVELVKNIKHKERKVNWDDWTNTEMQTLEKQIAKITNPWTLTAKIQSVNGRDDQSADSVQASKEDDSDQQVMILFASYNKERNYFYQNLICVLILLV